MVLLRDISKWIGKKKLFEKVSSTIRPRDKIGLVGANGTGKTTLLLIIAGQIESDSGSVEKPRYFRIGYLPQEWSPKRDNLLIDHVTSIHEEIKLIEARAGSILESIEKANSQEEAQELAIEYSEITETLEHLGGYNVKARAEKIIAGLGFPAKWLNRPLSTLSGGWIMRAELARILLSEPDLILLDEPTNHLDLESMIWLEKFLKETKASVIIVSHDREFLNKIVNRVWELEKGNFYEYTGNYDSYEHQRLQRIEHLKAAARHQQERIREIEEFIARNRVRKDRARQVQSRIKMLEKIEIIEVPQEEEPIHFSFPEPERAPKKLVELRNITKIFNDTILYKDLNLIIEKGDRIAFIGPNGSGKTTLLKIIGGLIDFEAGERIVGANVRIGYYAQHQWERLREDATVFEEARSVSGDFPQSKLRQLLGAFRFGGEDVEKKVCCLSGGEKARLIICKILLERPNLLLLDEPTNHLDINSRKTLEKALTEYGGTICFISHDRRFINAIANKILYIKDGHVEVFPGNYNDFQEIWLSKLVEANNEIPERLPQKQPSKREERKRLEAQLRNELYRMKKPLIEEIERIEKLLSESHNELEKLQSLLADPKTYKDPQKAKEIQINYKNLQDKIKSLTSQWEEKSLLLEELESRFWTEKGYKAFDKSYVKI